MENLTIVNIPASNPDYTQEQFCVCNPNLDLKQKEWDKTKQRVRANYPLWNNIIVHLTHTLTKLQDIILDFEWQQVVYSTSSIKVVFHRNPDDETVQSFWN